MTREENLRWLNQEIQTWENECQSKHPIKEALYAARKALEQEPTTKNDLEVDWESYKDVDGNSLDDLILEVLQNNFDCGNTYGYKVADEIIGLLPSVTLQEPILDKIRAEIAEYGSIMVVYAITKNTKTDKGIEKLVSNVLKQAKKQVLAMIDKYKAESEGEDGEID